MVWIELTTSQLSLIEFLSIYFFISIFRYNDDAICGYFQRFDRLIDEIKLAIACSNTSHLKNLIQSLTGRVSILDYHDEHKYFCDFLSDSGDMMDHVYCLNLDMKIQQV